MNPLRTFCLVACLAAVSMASQSAFGSNSGNSRRNSLKPSHWLSASELQNLPALDEITLEKLERMSPKEGAELIDTVYHLSQIGGNLEPEFVPNKNTIPVYIMKPNGKNISTTLDKLSEAAQNEPNFGQKEVTCLITGLPSKTQSIKRGTRKLVQAFMERYDAELQQEKRQERLAAKKNSNRDSNEQDYDDYEPRNWKSSTPTGSLVIIDLGDECKTLKRAMTLNVEKTGQIIGKELAKLSKNIDAPLYLLGQQIGAHVCGAAAREFKRQNQYRVRRITALDPSKIPAQESNTLTGLARGDADFVVAIHTTPYGLGTPNRVGDVDFYPNGPSAAVDGCDDVIEASMRATRYFAESVRPGNEHNFPAIKANSMEQVRTKNGNGKRAYMGIATQPDLSGDYILEVNKNSPFGQNTPAERQAFQKTRKSWNSQSSRDY